MPLDEFEMLMMVVSQKGICFSELLAKLAANVADLTFWRMEFTQLAATHMPPEARAPVIAPLMKSAIDASIARLAVALHQPASRSLFDDPVLANSAASPASETAKPGGES